MFDQSDVEVLAVRPIKDEGFVQVEALTLRHRLYQGGWSPAWVRERTTPKPSVGVIAWDPVRQKVVMIEQFRPGLVGSTESPWVLEWVAGFCDQAGEMPEEAARRELLEEAGLAAQDLTLALGYWPSPGGSSSYMRLYLATVDSGQANGFYGLDHEGEDIRVVVLSLAQVRQYLKQGLFRTGMVLIGVQWLLANCC